MSTRTLHHPLRQTAQPISTEISEVISIARVLCIFFVVYAHTSADFGHMTDRNDIVAVFLEHIRFLLHDGLSRISVPLLGMVSGYLAFRPLPLSDYPAFIAKKFKALILPMTTWSVVTLVIFYLYGLLTNDAEFLTSRLPQTPLDWGNALFSITDSPFNPPLHFLREVFLCFLLYPFLYAAVTYTPYLSIAVGLLIFASNGNFFIFEKNIITIFNRPSIVGLFIFGMCLRAINENGHGSWAIIATKHIKRWFILIGIILFGAIELKSFGKNSLLYPFASLTTRIFGALFFWSLSLNLRNFRVALLLLPYKKYAFMTFCSHYCVAYCISQVFGYLFNWNPPPILSELLFLTSPILCYFAARLIFIIISRQRHLALLTGAAR